MDLNQAISKRIFELLGQKDWSAYHLAFRSGIPNSTLSNILLAKCKACNLSTILNICRGFNISLADWFDSDIFAFVNLNDN